MDLFSSPPPLAPPTKEEDKLSWLRLLRSRRVGPQTFFRLMTESGWDAAAALAALRRVASEAGVANYRPCSREAAEREYQAGLQAGAQLLFYGAPDYPPALAEIDDAPPILWAKGQSALTTGAPIALVGARNASSLGIRMARSLARELGGSGSTIVSGLARGIDTVVHEEALRTGTVAVVAGGVDIVYPRENRDLTERVAETGLIVSEQPPGLQPQARHFPRRNRIISGLSHAVVVVEAALKSGSLITARTALEQGRDVMAVPGHPFDPRAGGSNALIRDGAILVRNADDVLSAIAPIAEPARKAQKARTIRSRRHTPEPTEIPSGPPPQAEPEQTIRDRVLSRAECRALRRRPTDPRHRVAAQRARPAPAGSRTRWRHRPPAGRASVAGGLMPQRGVTG